MATITIPQKLLIQLRRLLHRHPELSGYEEQTARKIAGFLKSYNPSQIITGIGGNGVAAIFQYYNADPTILIRCELDALPIQEVNGFDYRSEVPGVSHKCGHDGHMAIVAGLAAVIGRNRPRKGRIVLLFQPSEEDGSGAERVLHDEKFAAIKPDFVFALHNLPGYAKNDIVCKAGNFTAATVSMIITMQGKTSHAGEPEQGINPAWAVGELLQEIRQLQRPAERKEFSLITPIQIQLGEEAFGTAAGYGELKLTLRTWGNKAMDELSGRVENLVLDICAKHQLKAGIQWLQSFPANNNAPDMTAFIEESAKKNKLNYITRDEPFRWGEDFGHFTSRFPGAMFGLGAGLKTPALHNPDYDFPDEITPAGIKMFKSIIDQLLNSP